MKFFHKVLPRYETFSVWNYLGMEHSRKLEFSRLGAFLVLNFLVAEQTSSVQTSSVRNFLGIQVFKIEFWSMEL